MITLWTRRISSDHTSTSEFVKLRCNMVSALEKKSLTLELSTFMVFTKESTICLTGVFRVISKDIFSISRYLILRISFESMAILNFEYGLVGCLLLKRQNLKEYTQGYDIIVISLARDVVPSINIYMHIFGTCYSQCKT